MKNENSCVLTSTLTRKILIAYEVIYVIIAILIKTGLGIFSAEMGISVLIKLSILSLALILVYIFRERKNIKNDIGLLLLMTTYSVLCLVFAGK